MILINSVESESLTDKLNYFLVGLIGWTITSLRLTTISQGYKFIHRFIDVDYYGLWLVCLGG